MAKTAQFGLPMVMPAQAQKHVTVNEAFARLDAVAQLRVISSSLQWPPESSAEGASYLVPSGASGEWQDKAGQIAVWSNGGWIYLEPKVGWRAWDESVAGHTMYDGTGWLADAVVVAPLGAALLWKVCEFDHRIFPGLSNVTTVEIPGHAQVLGVTGRVVESITGPGLIGWRVGVSGATDRYGTGLGVEKNSYLVGMSGTPVTYYSATPLLLEAEGGEFQGGVVRLSFSYYELVPSRLV